MPNVIYCYYCSRAHPEDEMRRITTKGGPRWRCIKSIDATKRRTVAERDAFGKLITKINSAKQQETLKASRNPELKKVK